jgi:hypothetical protein
MDIAFGARLRLRLNLELRFSLITGGVLGVHKVFFCDYGSVEFALRSTGGGGCRVVWDLRV